MTTSTDRESLLKLNDNTSLPHSRDSFKTSSSTWKHQPTIITPSPNAPEASRMAHQSGTNPYGQNPNRRQIGNTTSSRVLATPSGPPRKKVKTEHMPLAAFSGPHTQQGSKNSTRSKRNHEIPLAPETIDVDDNSVLDSITPRDNNHTSIGNSSPDELNMLSPSAEGVHSSKYPFNISSHHPAVRNSNPRIVADGENTEWANKAFSQDSSDCIPNRNTGQVREQVERFEAQSRKIDFNDFIYKSKNRMKPRKSFLPKQPSEGQPTRASPKKTALPLKEVYLDDRHIDDEGLEISWQSDKISIRSAIQGNIFGPFDIRINADLLTYHDPSDLLDDHDPIFQLKTLQDRRRGMKVECVTFKLDANSPGMQESYYTDLLTWLKTRVNEKEVIRASDRERVWEAAVASAVSKLSSKRGDSEKSRLDELRENEPRRARRSLVDDQSKSSTPLKRSASQSSIRYTPPSGNQKLFRQDAGDLPESVMPRRSTRNTFDATRSRAIDSDEVILVYPPGAPGAVNITNGDLHRLQPGEFLNDTLIEFGLKLWLKKLEQTDPTLASQIHVFNSFFYKKLNHQKKGNYESVRKWTSKFDIFQKKYIIVPINEHFHWYFAIICEPEHVLVPVASNAPSTRQQTRREPNEPNETPTASKPVSTSVSDERDEDKMRTSEAEVELTLHDFKGSCSISNIEPSEDVVGVDGGRAESPSALSYISDDISKGGLRLLSPTASDHEQALLRRSPSDEKMAMDVADKFPTNLRTTNDDNDPISEARSVNAASFYQHAPPKRGKGKRKADLKTESSVMEIDDDDDGGSVLSDTPKTYIFTFDSLGGRHPQAIKRLSAYLKMEAQDKKNIANAGSAVGKSALVPVQPNFCDCGIYLLHLAQTFMSDPVHYRRMILAQKSSVPNPERQVAWRDHQVTSKREDLAARILQLSDEWKKGRAAKDEAKQKEALNIHTVEVVESDCEIDILEPPTSKAKKKKTGHRLRG